VRVRRRWGKATAVLASMSLLGAGALPGSSLASGVNAPDCPAAMPVSQITAGMTGTGYTVSQGTNPEPFDVEVLGVLQNAIAPGRHMIIVKTDGPAIDKAGGIWFGMSGSPIYVDGKLLGAVAFGLGFGPSHLAGVTAGEDMMKILDYAEGGGAGSVHQDLPESVKLSKSQARSIAARAGMNASEVDEFARLKIPFSVSGVSGRGIDMLNEAAAAEDLPFIVYSGGSASGGSATGPAPQPGGNFAAALSYGDVTAAGVGTTTAVCSGKVLAFGHPFNFQGATTMGASNADAITIWDDPVFSPFKIANILDPFGTVDQDRLAGIRGLLGAVPSMISITSNVTSTSNNNSRQGTTQALLSEAVPFLTFAHMFSNIDVVFDQIGEGSSELTWTVRGTTESGEEWELNRSNLYISEFDISFESLFELEGQLYELYTNNFEEIDFTSVDVSAAVHADLRYYTIKKVKVARNDEPFAETKRLNVSVGDTVRVQVVLEPYESDDTQVVELAVEVPRRPLGRQILTIRGADYYGGGFFFFGGGFGGGGNKIKDFDDLIESLENRDKNNEIHAEIFGRRNVASEDTLEVDQFVTGRKRVRLFVGGSPGTGLPQ
jgi:hypothetical protein